MEFLIKYIIKALVIGPICSVLNACLIKWFWNYSVHRTFNPDITLTWLQALVALYGINILFMAVVVAMGIIRDSLAGHESDATKKKFLNSAIWANVTVTFCLTWTISIISLVVCILT